MVAIFAIYIATRIQNTPGPPGTQVPWQATVSRWAALIAAIPIIVVNWLSFQMKAVPGPVESVAIAIEPLPTAAAGGRSFTALWATTWLGTLLLLAAGAVVFLVLFVRRVGRGGAPKLETHWEGIGGGVGGWRMSSSLGYLLIAAVLSLFFTLFLFRFDFRQRELDLANGARPTSTPTATPAPAAR
jgi:hypothetical protein